MQSSPVQGQQAAGCRNGRHGINKVVWEGGGEETNGLNGLHKTRYQVIWLCVEGRHQPTREARRRDGWNLLHVHFTSVYLYTPLRGPDDGAHWGEGGGRINADVEKKNAASFPSDLTDHIQTDQTT